MTRTIFIVWLSAGVVLGWFVSRMFEMDHRRAQRLIAVRESDSDNE